MKNPTNIFQKISTNTWKTITLIITVALITILITTLISILLNRYFNLHLQTLGTITTIGVEAYGGNLTTLTNGDFVLDWGTLYPGTYVNRSFYIKSKSNKPITLNFSTSNWTLLNVNGENVTEYLKPPEYPHLNDCLPINWNYNGSPLNPTEEIYVTFTLKAESEAKFIEYLINYQVTSFSFDIIIVGTEV